MATQSVYQEQYDALHRRVRAWDRRLRLQQSVLWLPRSLMLGLLIGVIVAVISRLQPWLLPAQIARIGAAAVLLCVTVMLAVIWIYRRTTLQAARRFDVMLGLNERVSTALELVEGRIQTTEEFIDRQITDAFHSSRAARAGLSMPLQLRGREWLGALLLAAVLVALIVIPNPQSEIVRENDAQQAAIDEAAEALREIMQQVAADPNLTEEQRRDLLQALESSIDTLSQDEISPEEAFATVAEAQAALQEQASALQQQAAAAQEAVENASEALRGLTDESDPREADSEMQTPTGTIEMQVYELSQNLDNMSPQQLQQAGQALMQAGQALQNTNPQAGQSLNQAGQQLQQGNTQGAQGSLGQAGQQLQQGGQQQQGQQQSGQQLGQSAQQLGQQGNQIAQGGQQGNQQGQQQGQQGGQQGQQGGQQGGGQQGNQQGQQQDGGQQGGQGNQQGQQGQQGGGQGSGQQGQQPNAEEGGGGGGAGDGEGGAGSESGGGGQQQGPVPQDNNPDGEGEGDMPLIYAPRNIGGELGDEEIILEPDGNSSPFMQGEFAQNPAGSSSVPYSDVYADYADDANRALDNDYIPLGMRDVVREYFSSLDPSQQSGSAGEGGE